MVMENNNTLNNNKQTGNKFSNHNNTNFNMNIEDSELNRLIFQTNDRQRNRQTQHVDTSPYTQKPTFESPNHRSKKTTLSTNVNASLKNNLEVTWKNERPQVHQYRRETSMDMLERTLKNEANHDANMKYNNNKDELSNFSYYDKTPYFNKKTSSEKLEVPKNYKDRSNSQNRLGENANYILQANKNKDSNLRNNYDNLPTPKNGTLQYLSEDIQEQTIEQQMMKQTFHNVRSNSKDAFQSFENTNPSQVTPNQNYNQKLFRNTAYNNMKTDNINHGAFNPGNTLSKFNSRRIASKHSLNEIIMEADTVKKPDNKKSVLQNAGNLRTNQAYNNDTNSTNGYVQVNKYYSKEDTNINQNLLIANELS